MSMKVYRFGLRAPVEGASVVAEQMRLAHRYRNTLTEVVCGKRDALRRLMSETCGDVEDLRRVALDRERFLEDALAVVAKSRKATRSRSESPESKAIVTAARLELKEALSRFEQRRNEIWKSGLLQGGQDEIGERFNEILRNQRHYSGLRHGTYCLVEDAVAAADSDTPPYDGAHPNDPAFAQWLGEGSVAVQIKGGASPSELDAHTFLRIEMMPDHRTGRRAGSRARLWMRVGSNADRSPVWAIWPMTLHRPIPPAARIKRAAVHLRRTGPRQEWFCTITVDTTNVERAESCGTGAVAIDTGWRVIGDELRVAAWVADDGSSGELRLPRLNGPLGGLDKADEIRSIRDKAFDSARDALVTWLAKPGCEVPSWLRAQTKTLAQWHSANRLAGLAQFWRHHRFPGDEEAGPALGAWAYHDHHLWEWESEQRQRSLRARKEVYRNFAVGLARRFGTVVLENSAGLSKFARKAPVEEGPENMTARVNQRRASTHLLRDTLSQAFAARGGVVAKVKAADSTRTCLACGLVEERRAAVSVVIACPCGAMWDQDDSAARVLLQRWCEQPGGDDSAGAARKEKKARKNALEGESRRDRMLRMRAEKLARMEAAREAAAIAAE